MATIYYNIAVDKPLYRLFTYSYHQTIAIGTRVLLTFAGKEIVGIIWEADVKPTLNKDKILAIKSVFPEKIILDIYWRELIDFTAQYYCYPIGATVFTALPKGLRSNKAVLLPQPEYRYSLSENGKKTVEPKHNKQLQLWQALAQYPLTLKQAKSIHSQAKILITKWQENGLVSELIQPQADYLGNQFSLNQQQQLVCDEVCQNLNHFKPFLLYGITGSGKTEVYFEIMAKVLAQGKQVLFLLPEINLTPQLIQRLEKRFLSINYVILNSQMADGLRSQNYLKAMLGQVQLIVGTRLSIFTPLKNLGLIMVDEEHDTSFKQDNELTYQARDLAVWRAKQLNCPIVLGSATPSLESWQAAKQQRYQLLQLSKRANQQSVLPEIILDDVRRQKLDNGFSEQAKALLLANYQQGGLSLVYLNRRGYAPVLACTECGHFFSCTACATKLVLHRHSRLLRCHHCDYQQRIPSVCPSCGNSDLLALGQGTQRVEITLGELLPQARIVRVDRDSVTHKDDWANIYQQIKADEVDILVGTQMLAKGHDFARLNLIIVLNADGSLYSADFRSSERLFAELMQVSGRAGRANHKGRVLIQTQLPDHQVFKSLVKQDYQQFANQELANRQLFSFPPAIYSVAIRADAILLSDAMDFLKSCAIKFNLPEGINVLGPAPQIMMRLANRERAQLFLESHSRAILHKGLYNIIELIFQQQRQFKNVRFKVDVDPKEI